MRLTVEVPLRASRAEVWAAISSVADVNRELAPFLRVADSTHGASFDAEPWRTGRPVLWQLLFGFIPVDRHRIDLVVLPDGGGFRESSSSWWFRVWRHERSVRDDPGGGCIVRDDVEIEPRRGVPAPIIEVAQKRMFRRRHEYLRRRFG